MPKKSDVRESYFTTVFVVFIVCFAMALAALILTGVLYTKSNTTIYFFTYYFKRRLLSWCSKSFSRANLHAFS